MRIKSKAFKKSINIVYIWKGKYDFRKFDKLYLQTNVCDIL